jgi:predicted transcriptional regulator
MTLKRKMGRPALGKIRCLFVLKPEIDDVLNQLVSQEHRTRSDIIESALVAYAKGKHDT